MALLQTVCIAYNMYCCNRISVDFAYHAAFLFYGPSFVPDDLPARLAARPEGHGPRAEGGLAPWGLFFEDAPQRRWLLSHPDAISMFDITATFSRESHFPLTMQVRATLLGDVLCVTLWAWDCFPVA
jgi:alpha-1,3-fucosyltransferase 10